MYYLSIKNFSYIITVNILLKIIVPIPDQTRDASHILVSIIEPSGQVCWGLSMESQHQAAKSLVNQAFKFVGTLSVATKRAICPGFELTCAG